MKFYLLSFIAVFLIILAGFGTIKVNAAAGSSGGPWPGGTSACGYSNTRFPYHFLCPYDNNQTTVMRQRVTSGNIGSTNTILAGTSYIDVSVGFYPSSSNARDAGGNTQGVRLWTYVDVNDPSNGGPFNGFSNTSGGDISYACPGSNSSGFGTTNTMPIVYNYRNNSGGANGPDASPAAYNGSIGYEDCQSQGRMIMWTMGGNFTPNQLAERSFRINLDSTRKTGQQICLRTQVSVSNGGNAFPTSNNGWVSSNDSNTMSRIAKQSDKDCYTIVNTEPSGTIEVLNCSTYRVNNIFDPNHGNPSNVPINWRLVRPNSNGTFSTAASGTAIGTSTISGAGSFTTSTVYRLQVFDPDNQSWVDGESQEMTTPCDPPAPYCNSMQVQNQNTFVTPGGYSATLTRTIVFVNDDKGNLLRQEVYDGDSETFRFIPRTKNVYISVQRQYFEDRTASYIPRNLRNTWRNYSDNTSLGSTTYDDTLRANWNSNPGNVGDTPEGTIKRYDCYRATCSIDSVTDAATGGVVQAGRPYRVNYTIYNPPNPNPADHLTLTRTLDGHALSVTDGGNPHPVSAGVEPGSSVSNSYDVAAAPPNDFNVSATPQYFGSFDLGPACGTPSPVIVYNTFTLTPWPEICTAAAGCDDEDPSAINYRTAVQSDRAVNNVPSEGYAALTPNGGASVNIASYNASKNFAAGSPPPAVNDTLLGVYPARPVNAGDRYCAIVRLSYSTGLVSNSGNIAPGTTSGPTEREACFTVKNKPFFKVLGSGVSAGGNFQSTGVCSGGGVIGGYYRDDSTDPYFDYGQGAGTDLYALATGEIKGFASAQSNAFKSPVELTFANSGLGASDVQNRQSDPNLGGKFAVDNCLTDVTEPSDLTFTQTFNGNTRIPGRTIGLGQNRSIFVNGDAYIDNSITYVDNGNWDYEKVPSFVLKATGNIYIDSSVGTLDGTYIAAATGPSTNGQIYTCAKLNPPNNFELVPKPDRLSQCNRQLTVHGSFVARKVNLMRTYGSIRDEKPSYGVPGQPIGGRVGVTSPLVWSHAGKPAGYNECVLINEASEPAEGVAPTHHGWNDNWLCLDPADEARVDLDWTHGGSDPYPGPATPNCDNFIEATAELDPYTWSDNVLCTNAASVRLTVAQFGNPAGPNELCTQMYEPWDNDGTQIWQLNNSKKAYVCISTDLPSGGRTPDTLPAQRNPLVCSNSGGGASYTPRGGRLNTCAAEVFEFSPEFYLGQPATGDNEDEPIRFDALTSLPPVL